MAERRQGQNPTGLVFVFITTLCLLSLEPCRLLVLAASDDPNAAQTDVTTSVAHLLTESAERNGSQLDITSVGPVAATSPQTGAPLLRQCQYTMTDSPSETLYNVGDEAVEGHDFKYIFSAGNGSGSSACYVTWDDIESSFKNISPEGPERVANLWFECQEPGMLVDYVNRLLAVDETTRSEPLRSSEYAEVSHDEMSRRQYRRYDHLISYIKVKGCRLDMNVVHAISNWTDFKIGVFFGDSATASFAKLDHNPLLCHSFRNVVGIGVVQDSSAPNNLHHLSSCAGFLDEIVEVVITKCNMTSFPESLFTAMPNMRALMMDDNQVTSPVVFPWRNRYAFLPRNLSRTHLFNVLYSFQNSFDIAPNVFRRVYTLNGNRISNLTCFGLSGEFQYVSFERNGIKWISECGVFSEVKDLQFLSLANNELQYIPENLFSNLSDLKRLDLQQNTLRCLYVNLFTHLRNLEKLNLAGNRLVVLQDNIFGRLVKLTDLNLSNNILKHISDSAISRFSVDLKNLDLSNNTITAFPVIAFLLPNIKSVNLDHAHIQVLDFSDIDRRTTVFEMARSVVNPSGGNAPALENLPALAATRSVSFKQSKLQTVVYYNSSSEAADTFTFVMKFYTFTIDGSPLACDSNILNFTHQIRGSIASASLTGREPSFKQWRCAWPPELNGRLIGELKDDETYLRVQPGNLGNDPCPDHCTCYIRASLETIIVDCINRGLENIPSTVPAKTRELWLQNNSIRALPTHAMYFSQLFDLRIASNQLHEFPESYLRLLKNLHTLYLDDNLLGSLSPQVVQLHNLRQVRISGNPFRCDCRLMWMKTWLLTRKAVVMDWSIIKCSTEGEGKFGQTLVAVEDDHFVCPVHSSLGQLAVPVAVPVTLVAILLVLGVLCFWQRRTIKVLLYIHTGLHPFDRDPPPNESQRSTYDVAVCCSFQHTSWVMEKIVKPLEHDALTIFFYSRDAWLGESTSDNVRRSVESSRRLVVVLGEDWPRDNLLIAAVREGLSKCRKELVQYLVLVVHGLSLAKDVSKDIKDNKDNTSFDLYRYFLGTGRYISTQDKHFLKKLLYEMPAMKTDTRRRRKGPSEKRQHVISCAVDSNKDAYIVDSISPTAAGHDNRSSYFPPFQYFHGQKSQAGSPANNSRAVFNRTEKHCDLNNEIGQLNSRDEDIRTADDIRTDCVVVDEVTRTSDSNGKGMSIASVNHATILTWELTLKVSIPQNIFVWYSDLDLQFTLANVVKPCEQRGHRCILQDRDFTLGAAIQENIVHAAETCARSVFVLSNQTAENEWFMFTFHVAFERRLNQSRGHRLVLIKRHDVEVEGFAEEVRQVIDTSTVLEESDSWFESKIIQFVESERN